MSSEDAPLVPLKFGAPKGVQLRKAAAFGEVPTVRTVAPTVAPSVAPVRPAAPAAPSVRPAAPSVRPAAPSVRPAAPSVRPAAPSVRPAAPSVRPAPAAPAAPPAAPPAPPAAPADAGPTLVVNEVAKEDVDVVDEQVISQVKAIKASFIAGKVSRKPIPLPAEAPIMRPEEFTGSIREKLNKKELAAETPVRLANGDIQSKTMPVLAKNPVISSNEYVPVNSPGLTDFVVQTYSQYSKYLLRILKEGKAAADAPQEIDKDACKKRDPNKVETFYYQNFVRDYLNRGSPYRGLLVYHGLGSGKTCTSIAAAEALYWGGQKRIFVLTPATLSNNYRKDLGKCGYFPLRQNNYWSFLEIAVGKDGGAGDPKFAFVTQIVGLPPDLIRSQGGAWIPEPDKPSNWESLTPEVKAAIKHQQSAHLNFRFKFIHYNGVTPLILSQLAAEGVVDGTSIFDNAVIIVDEIHNLVRTINGTQIGGKPISQIFEKVEPREFTWSTPLGRERPGYRYPRGYTLYRLIQNAVGAKIIALSATPMINYAQEFSILLNLIGGERRMVEISLKTFKKKPAELEEWARKRADIDYYRIDTATDRSTVLNVTPVPFGFTKVVRANEDYTVRGFVREASSGLPEESKERNMDKWAVTLLKDLEKNGFLVGVSADAETAVATSRASGPGKPVETPAFKLHTFPMLPDDAKEFVENFIDRSTLNIINDTVLRARASGLISYYRGGSEELMPRTTRNEIVEVPMSEHMFKGYSVARQAELDIDTPAAPTGDGKQVKRKGMTAAEEDLYEQATKSQQTGFLTMSRAACNWVFPEEVPRPKVSMKDQIKLLGVEPDKLIAADLVVDNEEAVEEQGGELEEAVMPDTEAETKETKVTPLDATLTGIIGTLMDGLEAKKDIYLNTMLHEFSPKYAAILDNIRKSPSGGPALVYSQFKTLEGLGIFAAALRAAPEKYLPLDIKKGADGQWEIPESLMAEDLVTRPRYILYTGDQDLDKRRLLLQLYNADIASLPPKLAAQCTKLLAGAPDNRDGRICRVFMITQSGAEGISLFNTRQVHIMEPYWNNVRLQQVIGRAIRLCSHMNLPWDDRTVDVFTYLSVFSAKQKAEGSKTLMMADNSMTTDQMIFDIAIKKQKLADGLFEIAQSAAVDCVLHRQENGSAIQCFTFKKGSGPTFMYNPDWRKDLHAPVRAAGK